MSTVSLQFAHLFYGDIEMKLSFTRDNLFKGMNLATGLMILILLPIFIPTLGYMMLKAGINAFRSEEC